MLEQTSGAASPGLAKSPSAKVSARAARTIQTKGHSRRTRSAAAAVQHHRAAVLVDLVAHPSGPCLVGRRSREDGPVSVLLLVRDGR